MKKFSRWMGATACAAAILVSFKPSLAAPLQGSKTASAAAQNLPAGEGEDQFVKTCTGCRQLSVITSQHKTQSAWIDTVVDTRSRGADGPDDDMEKSIGYLSANFGPQSSSGKTNASSASAAAPAAPPAASADQALPPKKPQPSPQKVLDEHFAAFNSCDWNRLMAQYDDDMAFLSKDGDVVKGREAIGQMFRKALQPHSAGGVCGITLIPEQTFVVGDTLNVVWRAEAPFLAESYRGSEAFETRNGLLVLQVTTWDPSAMKMKK